MSNYDDWLSWDQNIWRLWFNERLSEKKQIYQISPDDLIASYNREIRHSKEYHGRELLELIQNADDAGLGSVSKKSKLTIKLTNDALFIANTGIPFSPEGIKSLTLSRKLPL